MTNEHSEDPEESPEIRRTSSQVVSVSAEGGRLTPMQRLFCENYVLNGGNGAQAAIDAGYGGGARNMAMRNLCKPIVVAEIKRMAVINVGAHLPIAIQTLLEIAMNPKQDAKARVSAAVALLDRGGMSVPKGQPTVAVQVNVNGQQADTLIEEIWKRRSDREERRQRAYDAAAQRIDAKRAKMSDIDDGMSDSSDEGTGGVIVQGPMPPSFSVPGYPPANPFKTAGGPE